ncbi:hypothetical protein NSS71_07970 [Niallia sp. FSL W8-0951]|uniref:hypothetical protein n=1 Tax=Niallia sp. FSL W8-0951 TaxID=2954639 RepID=UPI0030FBAAD1
MIDYKTWEEFRNNGLMWFVNTTLHVFGWTLIYDPKSKSVYPARCKFRGFSEDVNTDGYKKVSSYLKRNIDELEKEANE